MNKSIYVLDKRIQIIQPENGFKTSIDAVLLAAACRAKAGDHVLDMGCGVGSSALCLLKRVDGTRLSGFDTQGDHVDIALENARVNGLEANFVAADVRNFDGGPFDHVICNPPYNDAGGHVRSPSKEKALAMGHLETSLQDWLDRANRLLKHGGTLTMIHKADQVDQIIKGLKNRFGAIEIFPVFPKNGQMAKRVIIRAVRNSRTPAMIHQGIVLHQDGGAYTPEAENILRDMAAIL